MGTVKYTNLDFHRRFGDLVTRAIVLAMGENVTIDEEVELEFFYYKLRLVQSLEDSSLMIYEPTTEMKEHLKEVPLQVEEFVELRSALGHVVRLDPQSTSVLTPGLFRKLQEVIENFEMISPLFPQWST